MTDVAELDLRSLRSWLAKQQTLGLSRTTLARRATAARVFTAWLRSAGRIPTDAGATLGRRRRADLAVGAADRRGGRPDRAAAQLADDGSPWAAATWRCSSCSTPPAIRVGELCGLDIDDLDRDRNVVRVLGKGRKERTVPFGHPAARALDAWLPGAGRGSWPRARARRCSSARGPAHRPAGGPHRWCTAGLPRSRVRPTSGRTDCATPLPPTCSKVVPTCGRCRSCSATPRWPPRSSTPT